MATIKDLLSNMISKIHTKMDAPTGAEPHQQLVTDGNGDWVPVDRLAWKEGEKVEITWDGNTEGLISVDGADGTAALYKVSDLLLDDTVIKAGVIFLSNGLSVNVDTVWETYASMGLITEDIAFFAESGVAFVRRAGTSAIGFTFTETGVYFVSAKITDSVTNYTASFVSDSQTIHPIPAEYLPGYFKLFVVTAANGGDFENDTYTANMTRDEAMAVLQNYPFAVMKAGNKIYWLSIVLIQNDMFIMTFYDRSGDIEVTLMYNADGTIVFFNP